MNKLSLKLALVLLLMLCTLGFYVNEGERGEKSKANKTSTNDLQDNIAINQINMLFYNNGIGSYNRQTAGSGLYWPGGANATQAAIFEDGLLFGAKVGSEIRVGGSTYRAGLQAGKILPSGLAANPNDAQYKIWKIRRGWESLPAGETRTRLEYDYNNWPVEDGAPWVDVDNDGKFTRGVDQPQFIGDEVNFMVMNDMDASRSTFLYGMQPMGVEVQATIFGFNKTGPLGDMVFKKYRVINKGGKNLRDCYLSYWSDPDLGYANDDFVGCDTVLKIGYVYNGDNEDNGIYGTPPPAAAYVFFQGPMIPYDKVKYPVIAAKNLPDSAKFNWKWIKNKTNIPMTSFSFYINGSSVYQDPDLGKPEGSKQMYNYMTSKLWDGQPFIDPKTGQPANYCLAGDPVNGTGWYEGAGWPGGQAPGDRRILMTAGPFQLAPGDTQEVVVGIVLAKGTSNINSVAVLKEVVKKAQTAYDFNFNLVPNPPQPKVNPIALDKKIVFTWENNAESYAAVDPLITGSVDKTYRFEGYEIYQYSSIIGENPVKLATYDIANNGVKVVKDIATVSGVNVSIPSVEGTDEGLRHVFEATSDKITNKPFNNGSPYYFGVVAYAYNANGDPHILKTTHAPFEVRPQTTAIADEVPYNYGSAFSITRNGPACDAVAKSFVIDPSKLTGHKYEVFFAPVGGVMKWNLRDVTKVPADTLLRNQNFDTLKTTDFDYLASANIVDGFVIKVTNNGALSSRVKEVIMTKDGDTPVNPVGNVLPGIPREGVSVYDAASATTRGWWLSSLDATATVNSLQNFLPSTYAFNSDIEIRFEKDTTKYSEFYPYWLAGLPMNATTQSKFKGKNKIPLSVWMVNDPATTTDDTCMYLKVQDGKLLGTAYRDSSWSHDFFNQVRLVNDSVAYEEITAVKPNAAGYITPIPLPYPPGTNTKWSTSDFTTTFMLMTNGVAFPKPGTVVKVNLWKPLTTANTFTFTASAPTRNSAELAKKNIDKISVFPNPYFGAHSLELDKYQRFVRFTNLPPTCTIRIFTLAGIFVKKIERSGSSSQFEDWNLLNSDNIPVASGMFLAYVDVPGATTKVLKLAIIQETPYLDRL